MSEPYIGEIRLFAGNFAPYGYALCNGQLLSISENTTLFSLLGTTYGGDGQTNFALPDLRGRVPLHQGQGPGLSNVIIGQSGGAESVTLAANQLPFHTHALLASPTASGRQPSGNAPAQAGHSIYGKESDPHPAVPVPMNSHSLTAAGGGQPHENRQPTLALNFIIALFGIYPSQN